MMTSLASLPLAIAEPWLAAFTFGSFAAGLVVLSIALWEPFRQRRNSTGFSINRWKGQAWSVQELQRRLDAQATTRRQSDLAVLDLDHLGWIRRQLGWIVISIAVLAIAGSISSQLELVEVSATLIALLLAFGFVAGWLIADRELAWVARKKRSDLRNSVSIYLELVGMALTSGLGPSNAVFAASRAVSGTSFGVVEQALALAEEQHRSSFVALKDLGESLKVPELKEFGALMELSDRLGAEVEATLLARAEAAALKAQSARRHDESKFVGTVVSSILMAAGLVVFLAYAYFGGLAAGAS